MQRPPPARTRRDSGRRPRPGLGAADDSLLCEINDTTRYARHAGADALDDRLLAVYRRRYEQIIAAGKAANPTPASARSRSPAARLLARLGGFAADVLRFAYDLRVPFDNSQAERDIRMVKLRQS